VNLDDLAPIEVRHREWLQSLTTKEAIRLLETQKKNLVKAMSINAGNQSEPSLTFHLYAYGIRTIDAAISSLTDTNKFKEQTNKESNGSN